MRRCLKPFPRRSTHAARTANSTRLSTMPRCSRAPSPFAPERWWSATDSCSRMCFRRVGFSPRGASAPLVSRGVADHVARVFLVLLADDLHELKAGPPTHRVAGGPRFGVRSGIVDGDLVFERPRIGARIAFDDVGLLRLRVAGLIEPGLAVESGH